uniref:SbcC/MukB-like Walker B domain-containing protein n=1 Tax=Candidatus Limisoma sp. TaxID=3076476 RepID=UPI004028DD7A
AQQSGEIDRTTKKLEKARADYASMVEKASTACRDAETAVDIDAVNNALAVVAGKLREAAQAQTECDTQRRRFDDTNKLLAATKDAIAKITARLSERRAALANADKTAAESEAALAEFFAANPQIGEAALVSLSQTSRARIDSERDYYQRIMADADKSAGALASVEKMLENHCANRPALAEADTADSLQTVVAEKRAEADALLQSNALDAQRLADDKKQAEAHAAALVAAEKARAEKDKWDTLCKCLGDREGKQFRKVAQSFILSHLLNIANGYLCRFSDRYTLTCQPGSLVILVEDTHNPGVSQSANILSGGESFMVSLSLALALSRLNAADNGVDTLFIDEGFGTLSDECLTNVMDTLEALHQMGGRRVGIISHVDELSHRIPVQVRVERVDATRSEVEVVDTCGYAD